jgi:hypothetical protein
MNMVFKKKVLAIVLVGAMVMGSSFTALASETGASSATGTGTNTGHLDTEIVEAVLPTSESVASIFNFTIDPEDILASADKYTDGTTAAGAEFKNADLVYFKQANGATKTYASTSQAVSVKAQNYIDADVKVTATIAEPAEGKTIIPMAASDEEFTAATGATLILKLTVGEEEGVISSTGGVVTDKIDAQPGKFATKYYSTGYKLEAKDGQTWDGLNVQLSGKVKKGDVTADIVAPNVTLTWSVTKHVDSYVDKSTVTESANAVTVTLPTDVTLSKIELFKAAAPTTAVTMVAGSHYQVSGNTYTFTASMVKAWAGGKFVFTYSDGHTDTVNIN